MPFYNYEKQPRQNRDPKHAELVRLLVEEIRLGEAGKGPVIMHEQLQGSDRLHVYVIWDRWDSVRDEHRAAAILDAYKEHFGEEIMQRVSIALGLTQEEADAMGIAPE
ncbi:MAG: hypothetical protein KAV82_05205 [Phycisphaerae bacterium]|nr:hypothetical protein [Phycisphaerae bacterium]